MTRLFPYFWISIGIHAVIVTTVAWWGGLDLDPSLRTGQVPAHRMSLLMVVGNPVPAASSMTAAPPVIQNTSRASECPPVLEKGAQPVFHVQRIAEAETLQEAGDYVREGMRRTAQPPSQASLANPPGQSGLASEEGAPGEIDAYLAHIRSRIENNKKYPSLAWRAGDEGEMVFSVTIDRAGQITAIEVVSSCSSDRLLAAGRRSVENAGPFDRPPPHWGNGLTVRVPIRFSISRL